MYGLFLPVPFFSLSLGILSWLSCLDSILFYFLTTLISTIFLALSCFSCHPCLLVVLSILFCPRSFILSLLFLLSCLRYSVWTVIYSRLLWICYYILSTLSFFTFLSGLSWLFQILSFCTVLLSLFQNSCPCCSTKVLLSCSVFSHLSCLSSPFCSDPPVLSYHFCLRFLSPFCWATPPPSPAITVLSCSASSYFQSLSCPLQSFLSPVLSVTPDLFHLRTSIQTHNPVYGPGCHCQVLVNV